MEFLFPEKFTARGLVNVLVIVDVVHIDKGAFARFKCVPCPLDQSAKVILTLRHSPNFDDLDGDWQISCPQNLIDRIVDVIDETGHENREHVVVLYAAGIRGCAEIQLSHIADKFDDGSVVDRPCNLDRAEGPLVAIEQLLCALDERVREVTSHRANVNCGSIAFLSARSHSIRQHETSILAEALAHSHHGLDVVVRGTGFS